MQHDPRKTADRVGPARFRLTLPHEPANALDGTEHPSLNDAWHMASQALGVPSSRMAHVVPQTRAPGEQPWAWKCYRSVANAHDPVNPQPFALVELVGTLLPEERVEEPGRAVFAISADPETFGTIIWHAGAAMRAYLDDERAEAFAGDGPLAAGLWVWEGTITTVRYSDREDPEYVEYTAEGSFRRPSSAEWESIILGVAPW